VFEQTGIGPLGPSNAHHHPPEVKTAIDRNTMLGRENDDVIQPALLD